MNVSEYRKKRTQEHLAKGLCRDCTRPLSSKMFCDYHLKKKSIERKKRREGRCKAGLCVECRKPLSVKSKYYCDNHLKKFNKYKTKFSKIRNSAKKRNLPMDISEMEFNQWWNSQKKQCCYCKITEKQLMDSKFSQAYMTIDRIDNKVGYTLKNVCIACWRCNNLKSDFFNYNEWMTIVKIYIKPRLQEYHHI